MPNSSHMVPHCFSHFLLFFFHSFLHSCTHDADYHRPPQPWTQTVTHIYMHTQTHTFTIDSCLTEPSPVSQSVSQSVNIGSCWIRRLSQQHQQWGFSRQTPCTTTKTLCCVCVCVSVCVCVCMCLSMHQWFRLIHFLLHSTKMHTRLGMVALWLGVRVCKWEVAGFDTQCLALRAFDVVPSPAHSLDKINK